VKEADLVIGAVLITGRKAPTLVSKDMISSMSKGSVVVDVAVDQGGCIETCKPTSHAHPTYEVDGVIHYCVPNMPGVVSRTSTYALTNVTLKYASMIAQLGLEDALAKDAALMKGLNVYGGYVCYEPVARDLNLEYRPYSPLKS
jgi:alanine dehydrogenase